MAVAVAEKVKKNTRAERAASCCLAVTKHAILRQSMVVRLPRVHSQLHVHVINPNSMHAVSFTTTLLYNLSYD